MTGPFGTYLLVVALLVANAFFVAAEFALVKAKPARLDLLVEAGSTRATLNLRIREHMEAYLAACQLGITMASLGLGWVGEPAVAALLEPAFHAMQLSEEVIHTAAFLIGFVVFSSLHIVVGEQVPKTFAIRKAEPVALWVAWPLHAFYQVTYPLNWALNAASGAILGLFRVAQATHADVMTDDEIRGVIQASEEHGSLTAEKAEMLQAMFEFGDRTAGEVMLPRGEVDFLDVSADADANARTVRETGHSRFPLVDGGPHRILGIVLTKELFHATLAGEAESWSDLRRFVRQPLYVPESMPVQKLFEMMKTTRAHMAFVVDEYGEFAGLVTMEDLLEEIVGDIADELDEWVSEYAVRKIDEHWEAHGLAPLSDVERVTGLGVPPTSAANTLSGLFSEKLERLPEQDDTIEVGAYRLTVLSMKDRRVEQVRIELVHDVRAEVEQAVVDLLLRE